MKHAFVIKTGSTVIGVYSNFKKFWESIENRDAKQHYATIMLNLRYSKGYDLGSCRIQGKEIENVNVSKVVVNHLYAR